MAKRKRKSVGTINSCPRCGGHLARESGFWRCEKCGHVKFHSQNLRAWMGHSPSTDANTECPPNEFTIGLDDPDNYSWWKGTWTKVVGKTKEIK